MKIQDTPRVYRNTRPCPVCGSDMKRDKIDNIHDVYTEHFTCCNQRCTVSVTFRN